MEKNESRVCVAVGVPLLADALKLVELESVHADVIEIRLDYLEEKVIDPFFSVSTVPLLFTNRPEWEGGHYKGEEEKRIDLLIQAVDGGGAYIDCELRSPVDSRRRLKNQLVGSSAKLILSWHDFILTPSEEELRRTVVSMQEQGADIGKIVTMAHNHIDVLHVLKLQEIAAELNFPLIAFCMGRAGMISRLATVELGGYMTYCAPEKSGGTAPGQLSGKELRGMLAGLR